MKNFMTDGWNEFLIIMGCLAISSFPMLILVSSFVLKFCE